jgi:hypothetical protein
VDPSLALCIFSVITRFSENEVPGLCRDPDTQAAVCLGHLVRGRNLTEWLTLKSQNLAEYGSNKRQATIEPAPRAIHVR